MKFLKTTGSGNEAIQHKFLCMSQTKDCSNDFVSAYLTHLDFDTPFNVVDDTSVLFTGKIVVGGTSTRSEDDQVGSLATDTTDPCWLK